MQPNKRRWLAPAGAFGLIVTALLVWQFTLSVSAVTSVTANTAKSAQVADEDAIDEQQLDQMVLPVPKPWRGDFKAMRERRLIRILVPYSQTFYSIDRATQHGISYELGQALGQWLKQHYPSANQALRWQVLMIPVARNELLPKLREGVGDIAAGGLTITESRLKQVDFTAPFAEHINEVVVTSASVTGINSLDDLAGRSVTVRESSSYFEHLLALNKDFKNRGLKPIKIERADENLEVEDLLQMVNAGLLDITVVDQYIATAWQPEYPQIKIHDDWVVHADSEFAWAIRKGSPQLKAVLDGFIEQHKLGTLFGNDLRNTALRDTAELVSSTTAGEMKKFKVLVGLFQKHAQTYGFDYLMLMALGYQESRLNQKARSPYGAVGVMQMLPSTAKDPSVAISGIESSADANIEAGSKYLRGLIDAYLTDDRITPTNQMLLAFAAYNAGPANLRRFRSLAKKSGLDEDIWFGNVEHSAARIVGRETVDYVGNIYKYYIAYKLAEQRKTE
ncbi:lytic transglycosylase F [Pseudomonas sp. M30-35]|uniref:transglycosylase SLT domain-containing protein n=1 Tax=Pseudomonas sp. M30-35 TaxID=1981174 RepID=UPI000B3CDC2C|nr:lytic transglycosylase F [Pseudomonas sp. M30-35]ARU88696.1 lytic transglycosylase F [Pseudomonas sp. M30-35]